MLIHAAQTDCFSNVSQDFLICSTVHKARQLGVFTGDTYVRLSLGKTYKNTKSFPNSENPFFNEYFVFELRCKLGELLRLTILYEVRKRTACKKDVVLGALLIDLQSVWNQSNHCFFKKWGRLEAAIGGSKSSEQNKGYLQIDLAIVSQASNIDALQMGAVGKVGGSDAVDHGDGHCLDPDVNSQWQLHNDYDDIDKNLLQDVGSAVHCNIQYSVSFFRAALVRKGDYMLQYRFHPFKGKTTVCKGTVNPNWNEEISFAGSYPSLAQTFLIQLLVHEHLAWKSIAEVELYFDEIAFKDKPLLGPTFLHLYDPLHPTQYIGRLLMEIRSECLTTNIPRQLITKPAAHFEEQRWWQSETFLVEFVTLHGDFLHGNLSNLKVSLKLAENASSYVECFLKNYPSRFKTSKVLKFFKQPAPYKAVHLKIQLPDSRRKFESDLFMHAIVNYMKFEIESFKLFQLKYTNEFQMQAKCLKVVILNMFSKIKKGVDSKKLEYSDLSHQTAWDVNRGVYLQDFFRKLLDELQSMRQRLKFTSVKYIETTIEDIVQDLIKCTQELIGVRITARIQDEWPDLLIILSMGTNKDLAVCKLNAKYFLQLFNTFKQEENDLYWRVRNFVFKDIQCNHTCINCGCTIGILQGCLSIIAEAERGDVVNSLAEDWQQTEPFYWTPSIQFTIFKCRIFIHQAKVRPGNDRDGLCDPYVRVLFGGQSAETNIEQKTLSPIWNQVICFEHIAMPGRVQWYELNPPVVAVEIYDADKHTSDDYLGCGMLPVSVLGSHEVKHDDECPIKYKFSELGRIVKTKLAVQKFQQLKYLSPPPLKWVPMATNGCVRSEVLMSAEMVEVVDDEELRDKDTFTPPAITQGIPSGVRPIMRNYVLEVVFAGFRNYSKGGRHRVKIMMGDLQLNSGLSSSRIKNSINFLVLYASGVLSLPEQIEYWPSIIATDVLVSSRGAETTVGAVLIPNSKRFLQKEKSTKCSFPQQPDAVSSIGSTTVHFEDDNEESLLIEKTSAKKRVFKAILHAVNLCKWKRVDQKDNPQAIVKEDHNIDDRQFNWWTKFYNSLYPDPNDLFHKHKLVIYKSELEKNVEFSYMHDWAEPVKLVHGVKYKKNTIPKEEIYGTLKLQLKVTPCQCNARDGGDGDVLKPLVAALNPKYQSQLQSLAELRKIVVRVYVVQGIQIRPKDKHSHSDSYVRVQFGTKVVCNRAHYIPNQSNPIYGKLFQLEGVVPREHMLEVSVFDRNRFRDEIIGSTCIDLEDRWRSRHRATVGIALEYSKSGYNKWRDVSTPHEILVNLCKQRDIKAPTFAGDSIEIDEEILVDETKIATGEDLQERLSLTALQNLEKLRSFGYKLVPEHVETRPLYRKDYPGIEQGKIQLWIELYEGDVNIPPAIDITPLPPQAYELRVIIYDCSDVVLQERNLFGSRMSDIYVKGWCSDASQHQSTDIHYRSLDGKANFNWRMIFPLKYSDNEDMMIVKRKSGLEVYETKTPPVLVLQLWDEDKITKDDFLGTIEINLSNFFEPFDHASACKLPCTKHKFALPFINKAECRNAVNLFKKRKIRGWFPLIGPTAQKSDSCNLPMTSLTGKIDVDLEVLLDDEAALNPCGLGREPPNALPLPVRPDTSFNPLTNPLKGLKKIILPFCKKLCLCLFLILLVGLLLGAFFLQMPAFLGRLFTP